MSARVLLMTGTCTVPVTYKTSRWPLKLPWITIPDCRKGHFWDFKLRGQAPFHTYPHFTNSWLSPVAGSTDVTLESGFVNTGLQRFFFSSPNSAISCPFPSSVTAFPNFVVFSAFRYGPREVTRREDFSMKGQLMCEFKFATFSCQLRRTHQQDGEMKDYSVIIEEALKPAVRLVGATAGCSTQCFCVCAAFERRVCSRLSGATNQQQFIFSWDGDFGVQCYWPFKVPVLMLWSDVYVQCDQGG